MHRLAVEGLLAVVAAIAKQCLLDDDDDEDDEEDDDENEEEEGVDLEYGPLAAGESSPEVPSLRRATSSDRAAWRLAGLESGATGGWGDGDSVEDDDASSSEPHSPSSLLPAGATGTGSSSSDEKEDSADTGGGRRTAAKPRTNGRGSRRGSGRARSNGLGGAATCDENLEFLVRGIVVFIVFVFAYLGHAKTCPQGLMSVVAQAVHPDTNMRDKCWVGYVNSVSAPCVVLQLELLHKIRRWRGSARRKCCSSGSA
jgi:hypothetical protein